MTTEIIVAYDVSDDRTRTRVAHTLQAHGTRIQRSVFVVAMDPASLAHLIDRLITLIDPETDRLHVLRQCAACRSQSTTHGTPVPVLDDETYWSAL
jgi:CRISPR-associated protein Cas2